MYNYEDFKQSLANHESEEKRRIYEKYIKYFGNKDDIKEEPFYKKYLSKFPPISYMVPIELKDIFNWDLLLSLTAGSFSSKYEFAFKNSEDLPDLLIKVQSGDESIEKSVYSLWSFQILKLYEIYTEEIMNFEILCHEDEDENESIEQERAIRIKKYLNLRSNILNLQEYNDSLDHAKVEIKRFLSKFSLGN